MRRIVVVLTDEWGDIIGAEHLGVLHDVKGNFCFAPPRA